MKNVTNCGKAIEKFLFFEIITQFYTTITIDNENYAFMPSYRLSPYNLIGILQHHKINFIMACNYFVVGRNIEKHAAAFV